MHQFIVLSIKWVVFFHPDFDLGLTNNEHIPNATFFKATANIASQSTSVFFFDKILLFFDNFFLILVQIRLILLIVLKLLSNFQYGKNRKKKTLQSTFFSCQPLTFVFQLVFSRPLFLTKLLFRGKTSIFSQLNFLPLEKKLYFLLFNFYFFLAKHLSLKITFIYF